MFFSRFLRVLSNDHQVFHRNHFPMLLLINNAVIRVIIARLSASHRVNERRRTFIGAMSVLHSHRSYRVHHPTVYTMVAIAISVLSKHVRTRIVFLIQDRGVGLRTSHVGQVLWLFSGPNLAYSIRLKIFNSVQQGFRSAATSAVFFRVVMFGVRFKMNANLVRTIRAGHLVFRL